EEGALLRDAAVGGEPARDRARVGIEAEARRDLQLAVDEAERALDVGRDADLTRREVVGRDRVGRRLAEDADVALARRKTDRARAIVRVEDELDVDARAEREPGRDALAVARAEAEARRVDLGEGRERAVAAATIGAVVADPRDHLDRRSVLVLAAIARVDAHHVELAEVARDERGIGVGDAARVAVARDDADDVERGAVAEAIAHARLAVPEARDGHELRRVVARDLRELIEETEATGGRLVIALLVAVTERGRRVEEIDAHHAVEALLRGPARLDEDHAAEAATVGRAGAARNEGDRLDERGMDHGAQTALVIEPRERDAVHVDTRVLRRGAPDHELAGAHRRAAYARKALDDAHHVAARAGHRARFFGREAALDDL